MENADNSNTQEHAGQFSEERREALKKGYNKSELIDLLFNREQTLDVIAAELEQKKKCAACLGRKVDAADKRIDVLKSLMGRARFAIRSYQEIRFPDWDDTPADESPEQLKALRHFAALCEVLPAD